MEHSPGEIAAATPQRPALVPTMDMPIRAVIEYANLINFTKSKTKNKLNPPTDHKPILWPVHWRSTCFSLVYYQVRPT